MRGIAGYAEQDWEQGAQRGGCKKAARDDGSRDLGDAVDREMIAMRRRHSARRNWKDLNAKDVGRNVWGFKDNAQVPGTNPKQKTLISPEGGEAEVASVI